MSEEGRIFKGLGLIAEVGGHPAGEGDDISGMSHIDLGFGIEGSRSYFRGNSDAIDLEIPDFFKKSGI